MLFKKSQERENMLTVLYVFSGKSPCLSALSQFKPVLFKAQLYLQINTDSPNWDVKDQLLKEIGMQAIGGKFLLVYRRLIIADFIFPGPWIRKEWFSWPPESLWNVQRLVEASIHPSLIPSMVQAAVFLKLQLCDLHPQPWVWTPDKWYGI